MISLQQGSSGVAQTGKKLLRMGGLALAVLSWAGCAPAPPSSPAVGPNVGFRALYVRNRNVNYYEGEGGKKVEPSLNTARRSWALTSIPFRVLR